MIRIAVCDDEAAICQQLEEKISQQLARLGESARIVRYTSALQLLSSSLDYDLIFLDVRMPDLDGLALARAIREKNCPCQLIFVTVLRECMPEAFEVEAAGYLCKPIEDARLESALKRVLRQLEDRRGNCLFIRTMNWSRSVKLSDILYCEVINRKIYLHTKTEVITYYGKINELEKQLHGRLIRCHRSYLVNPACLREYTGGELILEDGSRIPAARSRRQPFLDAMLRYMKEGN